MFSFFAAVAWYYIIATLFVVFSAIRDKVSGKEMNFEDVNLDLSVISIIYLFYYYGGGLE